MAKKNFLKYTRNDLIIIFSIALFVSVYFLLNSLVYVEFENTVVPAGDPFTYTVGFMELIRFSTSSVENYIKSLITVLTPNGPNWYWILNFLI
ncbi:hypothetical protein N9M22_05520, partial [Litoricolaceae bacterium]|nr:hypothetical protein [Litorivicinaceae bacterium]